MFKTYATIEDFKIGSENQPIVILLHAMFTNGSYLLKPQGSSFADYLANNDFQVKLLNFSGYSSTIIPKEDFAKISFESYVCDVVTAINEIKKVSPARKIFIVGHSVGGLAGLVAASIEQIAGIICLAPAIWGFTEKGNSKVAYSQRLKLYFAFLLSMPTGKFNSNLFGLGNKSAPHGYFKEFLSWNKSRVFKGEHHNYTALCKNIKTPVLILNGLNDKTMAPPENSNWISTNLIPSAEVKLVSKNSEFKFDGNHFSVIYGRLASENVWPKITTWLKKDEKNTRSPI